MQKLKHLQDEIERLNAQANAITERLAQAQRVASEAQAPRQRVLELRERRRQLLADRHLGLGDKGALAGIEKELTLAETEEREANERAEGALAAAERLTADRAENHAQLAALHDQLPGVLYAAHCERAAAAIGPYQQALELLAAAHAVLQGRLLAADRFANPRAGRPYVGGGLVSGFSSTLPAIPGYREREDVTFNMQPEIESAYEAALAEAGGTDLAEQVRYRQIEKAAADADRAMRLAMATVGAV
jgi:hypothetical protein